VCVTLGSPESLLTTVSQLTLGSELAIVGLYVVYLGQMIWPVGLAVVYPVWGARFEHCPGIFALLAVMIISVVSFIRAAQIPIFGHIRMVWFLGSSSQ